MRALVLDYAARRLAIDSAMPEPAESEVWLRVVEFGVCGTDRELAGFSLGRPPGGESRLILGHEAVAVVERSSVPGLRPGMVVVPSVRRACGGPCVSCARGRRDLCLTGGYAERGIFGLHGYAAEWAADRAEDLYVVPSAMAEWAVLVEPMSVVEKAISVGERLQAGEIRRMVVLGAGAVGLLAAWAGLVRGWSVTVVSREAEDSLRGRLVRAAGATFRQSLPEGGADLVIEAAGSASLAAAAMRCLAPLGVMVVLGARNETVAMPFLDLIVGNQVVAGSVNAGPEHFERAIARLGQMEPGWLTPLLERRGLDRAVEGLLGPAGEAIKVVHRLD